MNLMEIGKKPKIGQNEIMEDQMEKTKNLPDTIDRWKQPAQEQVKSLETLTAERNELQMRCQDMELFIQKLHEKLHSQRVEKQKLSCENHELQGEMQKLNGEMQQLTAELSKIQRLNQSLQQSNDDLRNRNGLQSRREQERIVEEIRNVRDQNSKLKLLVNASSVDAVSAAQKKQKEAEKKMWRAESRLKDEQKKTAVEIKMLKKELEKQKQKICKGKIIVIQKVCGKCGKLCGKN